MYDKSVLKRSLEIAFTLAIRTRVRHSSVNKGNVKLEYMTDEDAPMECRRLASTAVSETCYSVGYLSVT